MSTDASQPPTSTAAEAPQEAAAPQNMTISKDANTHECYSNGSHIQATKEELAIYFIQSGLGQATPLVKSTVMISYPAAQRLHNQLTQILAEQQNYATAITAGLVDKLVSEKTQQPTNEEDSNAESGNNGG